MKFMVLLALAGLASCSTTLIGGDRARDVKIQYTYVDENGREVQVEVEADRLGLDLTKEAPKATSRKSASTRTAAPVRFVEVRQPQPKVETRFVQVAEAPKPTTRTHFVRVVPAPEPKPQPVQTRFIQVADIPEREVETRFVQVAAVPRTQRVETRFVAAPKQEVRFAKVPVSKVEVDEVETRFFALRPKVEDTETRFIQVTAPARKPVARSRFVEVEEEIPFVFQTARATAPTAAPRHIAQHLPSQQHTLRQTFRASEDSSSEK